MIDIRFYTTKNKKEPFVEWLSKIKDISIKNRILARLDRVALKSFGDSKSIKNGIYELRLKFGSGYRIYYGKESNTIVILLCAGNKQTQIKDIKQARKYWQDYNERKL